MSQYSKEEKEKEKEEKEKEKEDEEEEAEEEDEQKKEERKSVARESLRPVPLIRAIINTTVKSMLQVVADHHGH
jgi:alpha-galactosidase/6-phospho-beta-glucosidase family protein